MPTAEKLRDVHAPARFFEGEVHWQMASGHDAIDASVTAATLHLLGPTPLPGFIEAFEQQRVLLCDIAAQKYSAASASRTVRLDTDDIPLNLRLGPG
jgi:hypothetical protein